MEDILEDYDFEPSGIPKEPTVLYHNPATETFDKIGVLAEFYNNLKNMTMQIAID